MEADSPGSATRVVAGGEYLFRQGDEPDRAYRVETGELEVLTPAAEGELAIARLGPGDLVGELAMVAGGTRTATVRARVTSSLHVLTRAEFDRMRDEDPELARRIAEESIRRLDETALAKAMAELAPEVPGELFSQIAGAVEMVRLRSGETLFERGDESDAAYFVVNGRLAVNDEEGDRVAELTRGEIVGELGLIESAPRSATVLAIRDTTLARVGRDVFDGLLAAHPAVMLHIARTILGRSSGGKAARGGMVLAVAVASDVDAHAWTSAFAREVAHHGATAHLWSGKIDEALGTAGICSIDDRAAGAYRLREYLHEVEIDHEYAVFEADREHTRWGERALRHADRVIIVVPPEPSEEEEARLSSWIGSVNPSARTMLVVLHPPGKERPTGSAALRERFGLERVVHIRADVPGDVARVARVVTGNATALALSGGGARGFAHLGVYRALTEVGVPVDIVAGTSIGSPIAAAIAQGLDPDEVTDTCRRLFKGLLDYTLPFVSLVKGERITRAIGAQMGGWTIEDLWLPFLCVSTNLTRSVPQIHTVGDLTTAIRASVAIPGVLPPVPFGGDLLVDGGVLDNLPIDPLRRFHDPGRIVAVDVAPPRGPRAKADYGLSVSGWEVMRSRVGRGSRAYPGIVGVLLRSMITASANRRDRVIQSGVVDLYLDLDLRGVGMLEFGTVDRVAAVGYESARPRIEAWLEGRADPGRSGEDEQVD